MLGRTGVLPVGVLDVYSLLFKTGRDFEGCGDVSFKIDHVIQGCLWRELPPSHIGLLRIIVPSRLGHDLLEFQNCLPVRNFPDGHIPVIGPVGRFGLV